MAKPIDLAILKGEALEELRHLLAHAHDITPLAFKPGEWIIREGERSQLVYVVLEGAYRVEQAAARIEEGPSVLAGIRCDPGSFSVIGEMACLGEDVRTASVVATEETRVLCLDPAHVDRIIQDYPNLTRVLLRQFAARLQEANLRIRELNALLARQFQRKSDPRPGGGRPDPPRMK
jgi:CRP-like cAMP-binding protein